MPLIIIQHNDGKKFLKPNLEPEHIPAWLKDYKVIFISWGAFFFLFFSSLVGFICYI